MTGSLRTRAGEKSGAAAAGDPALPMAVELLHDLIRIPSFSGEEDRTADLIDEWMRRRGMEPRRRGNNVWTRSRDFDATRPTVMLCSHHDTVRPVSSWEHDPFEPVLAEGTLTGLGSNDAGGCVVSMMAVFDQWWTRDDLPFNLVLLLTAEEEVAGDNGIVSVVDDLGRIDVAIVGEPTGMQLAMAEKGLLVLDCETRGIAGHAARSTGVNAISQALPDLAWFEQYTFDRESALLGPVKMTVTQINAGTQHNVVPDSCRFVVDVRVTDAYTHEQLLDVIRRNVSCDVRPRSMRLKPSAIDPSHPLVRAAEDLGIRRFGSPTMSDQALLRVPSVKIGPGRSERSHTSGEFILLSELEEGIQGYAQLLQRYAELTA